MYFYIDESGHTGNNLFDSTQPTLYYGVLSSCVDMDITAQAELQALKINLGITKFHAVDLSNEKLALMVPVVLELSNKYELTFDLYRVIKSDYVIVSFFDQVFDSGINLAVNGSTYLTSTRFAIILILAKLFDEETLKKAWLARTEQNSIKAENLLIEVCQVINDHADFCPDEQLKQIIKSALQWAQNNPKAIQYNVASKKDLLLIAPNLLGFQFALSGLAERLHEHKKEASRIVIDQQLQFNGSQQALLDIYSQLSRVKPPEIEYGLPNESLKHLPKISLTFASSNESSGLELVDFFLWIFKRHCEDRLSPLLMPIIQNQLPRGNLDELSIRGILNRWEKSN